MMFAVGEKVRSHWNEHLPTTHIVQAVHDNRTAPPTQGMFCQSGVLVRVAPALRGLKTSDWIDIGWFSKIGA